MASNLIVMASTYYLHETDQSKKEQDKLEKHNSDPEAVAVATNH